MLQNRYCIELHRHCVALPVEFEAEIVERILNAFKLARKRLLLQVITGSPQIVMDIERCRCPKSNATYKQIVFIIQYAVELM